MRDALLWAGVVAVGVVTFCVALVLTGWALAELFLAGGPF